MKDIKSTENKKQAYLKRVGSCYSASIPKPVQAMDLDKLFLFYKKKHGITLIKNGNYSPDLIKESERGLQAQLDKFNNQDLNYAFLLKEAVITQNFSHSPISIQSRTYPTLYKEIQQHLAPYLSQSGRLKQDLSDEEMSAVQDLCKNKFSDLAKSQLNKCLRSCFNYFEEQLEDVCLSKQQAIEEIKKIQATLGEQQAVGYVFTNNKKHSYGHFESIIITKNAIYKPIEWTQVHSDKKLSASDFNDDSFYSAHLEHFWSKSSSPGYMMPQQQADIHHCGVLGITGLKRLLQNDAVELTRNSLAFSFYTDVKGSKQHLFIPSTIFLQYSQSSKYMDLLSKIVGSNTSNDLLEESQQTNRYSIPTLEQVLLQSIEYAEIIGDKKMMEQNKETLAALPAFREQWQQGYEVACRKHDVFYDHGKYKHNFFLNFLADRIQDIIANRSVQVTNTNGFFATPDCNNPLLTKDNDNSILKINNN